MKYLSEHIWDCSNTVVFVSNLAKNNLSFN